MRVRLPSQALRFKNKHNRMKLTESQLRKVIREELLREDRRENLERLDNIRRRLNRFQKDISDQSFEGAFTRGETQELERKFEKVRGVFDEIERILIETR